MFKSLIQTSYFQVELEAPNEDLIKLIQHDSSWFPPLENAKFKMKIKLENNDQPKFRHDHFQFSFKTKQAQVLDKELVRRVEYFDGALVEYDYQAERGLIQASNNDRLHDLVLQLISSRTGKMLDLEGLHKIHACAVSLKDKVALILMPVGGGKSTLLLELLKDREFRFVSDDTPLVDTKRNVHPYPFRIGKSELPQDYPFLTEPLVKLNRSGYGAKYLLGSNEIALTVETSVLSKKVLIFGAPSENDSKIEVVNKGLAFYYLWKEMVIGIGLPQIIEFYWSFALLDLMRVMKIGFSRLFLAIALVRENPCYRLYRGPDHTKNASLIKKVLSEL